MFMERLGNFYESAYIFLKKIHLVSGELEDKRLEASNVKLVVFLVFLMMMLDNMLLTVVVPIIPPILYKFEHGNMDYYTHHQKHANLTKVNKGASLKALSILRYGKRLKRGSIHKRVFTSSTSKSSVDDYEEYYVDYPEINGSSKATSLPTILASTLMNPIISSTTVPIAITTQKSNSHVRSTPIQKSSGVRTAPPSTLMEVPLPEDIINENKRVGMLFASKAIVQLFINPLIGPVINKVGYGIPLCFGFVVLFISSIMFAFGKSYGALLMARSTHGISSACLNISGLALIAERFPNDRDRSIYMGRAMSGMAFGVFVGYPFGSVLFQFIGDSAPFWIISLLVILIGSFTVYIIKPVAISQGHDVPITNQLLKLIKDKYILIATGSILCSTTSIAVLEPSLPIWLMNKIHPAQWKLGTVFLPDSFGYLIGTNLFGKFAFNYGRWKCAIISMVMIAICLILIPFANHPAHLVLPHFGIGLGIGVVDSSLIPYLGYIVDMRYSGMYGAVYSMSQIAVCLAYGLGPSIGGSVVKSIGFRWLVWGTAILNLAYAPALWYLKNPPEPGGDSTILMNELKKGEYSIQGRAKEVYGRLKEDDDAGDVEGVEIPDSEEDVEEWTHLSHVENGSPKGFKGYSNNPYTNERLSGQEDIYLY